MNTNPATTTPAATLGVGPYRLITYTKGAGWTRTEFATRAELIVHVITNMGRKLAGLSTPGRTRPQLWNQPRFTNLCGPIVGRRRRPLRNH